MYVSRKKKGEEIKKKLREGKNKYLWSKVETKGFMENEPLSSFHKSA